MKKEGFTLIELLIYVSVFIILITAITLFALTFTEATAKTRIKREVSLGAYSALKAIVYEIQRADKIYTSTSFLNSHPGQLSLETTHDSPIGEIKTYIDFYLDNQGRLYIKKEGQQPRILISEDLRISNLKFISLVSSKTIRINLTLENNTSVAKYQYSYSLNSSASIRK